MKWREVAKVKFQAGATFGFTTGRSRPRYETVAIFLGPKRVLKCGCGKTYFHKPDELEVDPAADTCKHIKALYGNGGYSIVQYGQMDIKTYEYVGKVYLSPLGKELFAWRHVAQALE